MGSPTIFSGNDVRTLKSNISLNGIAKIMTVDYDPADVGLMAPNGSLALNYASGKLYQKTDAGDQDWRSIGELSGLDSTPSPISDLTGAQVGESPLAARADHTHGFEAHLKAEAIDDLNQVVETAVQKILPTGRVMFTVPEQQVEGPGVQGATASLKIKSEVSPPVWYVPSVGGPVEAEEYGHPVWMFSPSESQKVVCSILAPLDIQDGSYLNAVPSMSFSWYSASGETGTVAFTVTSELIKTGSLVSAAVAPHISVASVIVQAGTLQRLTSAIFDPQSSFPSAVDGGDIIRISLSVSSVSLTSGSDIRIIPSSMQVRMY